jgi:RNA polymerase sigma-70 factor (ECF subfamily)
MNEIKEIWLPLSNRFYRVAYHILESQEDAEDAVQELYFKLIKTPDKFSNIQDPAAYGITILRNICIDIIRRREKRRSEELHEYMIADVSGPDKVAADKDKLRILVHEIDRLPQKQSMVLKMRTIDGLEYEEIAQRTGLSQVNIRVLISIARKTLKKNLGI